MEEDFFMDFAEDQFPDMEKTDPLYIKIQSITFIEEYLMQHIEYLESHIAIVSYDFFDYLQEVIPEGRVEKQEQNYYCVNESDIYKLGSDPNELTEFKNYKNYKKYGL